MNCIVCNKPEIYAKQKCFKCYRKQKYYEHHEQNLQRAKKWKQQNKEHIKQYTKQYWQKNGEKQNAKRRGNPRILAYRKKYYQEHHKEELQRKQKYDKTHKKEIKKYSKKHYWENPEIIREKARRWAKQNLPRKLEYNMKYYYKNYSTNTLFKLQRAIRKDIHKSLKKKNFIKNKKTFTMLGYNLSQLKEHLEKQFDEKMNWENYGTYWHIDHITPISWAKTKKEIIEFNQLKNLQPLEATENIRKNNRYSGKPTNNMF